MKWAEFTEDPWFLRRGAGKRRQACAFVSYRHLEAPAERLAEPSNFATRYEVELSQLGPGAKAINDSHRKWVQAFVDGLRSMNVDVVWDQNVSPHFRGVSPLDPQDLDLAGEMSRVFPLLCHAFIPILTPRYLERIGILRGERVKHFMGGGVFEEWSAATHLLSIGLLDFYPIVRSGDPRQVIALVPLLSHRTVFDLTGDESEAVSACTTEIAWRLENTRQWESPMLDITVDEAISLYIDWCRGQVADRKDAPVEAWRWDYHCPVVFINSVLRALREANAKRPEKGDA